MARNKILEFTPLEFETQSLQVNTIMRVTKLEFTPLEFETKQIGNKNLVGNLLEFTPLEFETKHLRNLLLAQGDQNLLRWSLKRNITGEINTSSEIRIYSVGV